MLRVIALIILLAAGTYRCSSSTQPTENKPEKVWRNLLVNSSFEFNGSPSDSAWVSSWFYCDNGPEDIIDFISAFIPPPPNGGSYCLALPSLFPIGGSGCNCRIYTTVPAPTGTHCYKLSFWLMPHYYWDGYLYPSIKRNDTLLTFTDKSYSFEKQDNWFFCSLIDTINTQIGDSLVVRISCGGNPQEPSISYYDLCKLEILENK